MRLNYLQVLVVLAILPVTLVLAQSGMAKIVTDNGSPEDCLAPIAITRVDGEIQTVAAKGFSIEWGVHTINGRAMMDTTHCPLVDRALRISTAPDLEVFFAAGNTYYIGYDHRSSDTADWKLVVWKVEEDLYNWAW